MSKNLEIKAYCPDLEKAENKVKKLATKFLGIDNQTDTYFRTSNGRFKLRESSLSGSYLIPYLRPDQANAKISMYAKIDVQDYENVKSLFEQILGVELVIRKQRTIYLYKNVRIHLDNVEDLGTFIEFEAVFDESGSDEKIGQERVDFLMKTLDINQEN